VLVGDLRSESLTVNREKVTTNVRDFVGSLFIDSFGFDPGMRGIIDQVDADTVENEADEVLNEWCHNFLFYLEPLYHAPCSYEPLNTVNRHLNCTPSSTTLALKPCSNSSF